MMIDEKVFTRWFNGNSPHLTEPLDWSLPPDAALDSELLTSHGGQIAITGRHGVGKKTLCSTLWGWTVAMDETQMVRRFGRMLLVDLPDEASADDQYTHSFTGAQIILYVLDAAHPISDADLAWATRLRALNRALIVVANKVDQVERAALKPLLATLRERFGCPVIPSVATDLLQIQRTFLPAVLKACPDAAETLASEIVALRQRVAWNMTLRAAFSGVMISTDGDAERDPATLVSVQMRLMHRIGMLYGFNPSGGHGREWVLTLLLSSVFRLAPLASTRFPRLRTWMVCGALAGLTTLIVGRVAVVYYSAPLPGWLRWL